MRGQEDYTIPATPEQLVGAWSKYHNVPEDELVTPDGVLGVVRQVSEPMISVVSVDLCEVIRNTCVASFKARNEPWPYRQSQATSEYDRGGASQAEINAAVRKAAHEGIPSLPGMYDIRNRLSMSRQLGMYVVANTSIIEGCELPTIDKRGLGRYAQEAFDGIVFPRNYNGLGKLKKPQALLMALEAAGIDPANADVAHIDDTPHHLQAFHDLRHEFGSLMLVGINHLGNRNQAMPNVLRFDDRARAFETTINGLLAARVQRTA